MNKYLYGASVQGIQNFIFKSNKLKEIIGASELVEQICTREFAYAIGKNDEELKTDKNVIMNAAGNIKYIFEDGEKCKKLVREFPKHISNFAPGITLSQAVVKLTDDIKNDIDKLEKQLKTQLNKVQIPIEIGCMGVERARRTGKPAFDYDEKDQKEIDRETSYKQKVKSKRLVANFLGIKEEEVKVGNIPFDIEKITGSNENSWLAIIHADGNGLGNTLQNLANNISSNEDAKKAFKTFSKKLEEATNEAAQAAFHKVVDKNWQTQIENSKDDTYPLRPVVLGGDDLIVIIRADLAFDFTIKYLQEFEKKTKEKFSVLNQFGIQDQYLTACAGIAYIKSHYPFHYGVNLAENLTGEAKKFSKSEKVQEKEKLPPSSLSFYKVQASFIEDLKEMKTRTHFIKQSDIHFDYGPYLLCENNGHPNVGELNTLLEKLAKHKTKGVSKLRQWISELYNDKAKADFMLNRLKSINEPFYNELKLENSKNKTKLIYKDLIDLHTFKTLYHEDYL